MVGCYSGAGVYGLRSPSHTLILRSAWKLNSPKFGHERAWVSFGVSRPFLSALIHRSAQNWRSSNFAGMEFSEVRCFLGALSYLVLWSTYIPLRHEYSVFVACPADGA